MQLIFRGDPIELARGGGLSRTSIDVYGLHFQMGVAVDVSGLTDQQKRKLANNRHFEVVAEDDVAAVEAAPAAPEGAEASEDAAEAAATAAHVARASSKRRK